MSLLIGRRRVGKDVVASFLEKDYGFTNRKFSEPLKTALCGLFDWSKEHLEGSLKDAVDPRWGVSPRRTMQFFGTEVMQFKIQELLAIKPREFFVKRLFNDIDGKLAAGHNYVISDVRFRHEVNAIKERGGITIRIKRTNDGPFTDAVGAVDAHESETTTDVLEADHEVVNDSTIENLYAKIRGLHINVNLTI